ncbi:MAG: hypothetical protein ACTHOO_03645 [Alcanivorax sp.]
MANTEANDAVLVQQVLINNLEELGFRSITAEMIGDREGVPDGIVGNGTSTALHVLALMAQIEAGVEPADMNTGYNADSAPLIIDYVREYAGEEAAAQFEEGIDAFYPGGEFNQDYDEATLHLDNAARELNVAEFRRLGEGAVEMVEGTPPSAPKTEAELNASVAAMQEVIFTGDILEHLGMERTEIGNYQTGEADGILGKGSSEAFQKLVILSERAAGRDDSEITGVYDATLVRDYLEANGVTTEDAQKFVDNATELNTDLYALYAQTDVDAATVRLPETTEVAGTLETGEDRIVKMNYAQAEFLGQVAASEAGTGEDLLMSIAYGEAAAIRSQEIGLTDLQAELQEKQTAYTALLTTDTSGLNTDELEAHNASVAEAKAEIDGLTVDVTALQDQLRAAEIDVSVPEGISDDSLTGILASVESLATPTDTTVASNLDVEDPNLTGSVIGSSEDLTALGPVAFSDELDGMPNLLTIQDFGPSPTELYGPFIAAGDTNAIVSLEVKSGDDPTAPMTHERFEDLQDKTILSNDEKALLTNYPAAYEAALEENGIAGARERLETATTARDALPAQWDALKAEFDENRARMSEIQAEMKDQGVTFTATMDGQEAEYTYSFSEIDQMESDSWYDTSEEQAFFDAGREAYRDALAANPEYAELVAKQDTLDDQLYGRNPGFSPMNGSQPFIKEEGTLYQAVNGEYADALQGVSEIEQQVQGTEIAVSVIQPEATDATLTAGVDNEQRLQTAGI